MAGIGKAFVTAAAGIVLLLPGYAHAKEIDWGKVPANEVKLFYPGTASWDFLNSDDHRLGAREIKQLKKDCRHCHLSQDGELDLKADEIAAGTVKMKRSHNPFEPEPEPEKKGMLTARVQAAYDNNNIYIRVSWPSKGTGWGKGTHASPDRVTLQVNKTEPAFKKYGCFITCHNDLNTMPESPSKKDVLANPYYKALKRDDVRLYAYNARKSWSSRLAESELEKIRSGGLIEVWSVELGNGAAKPMSGWIFDDRRWDNEPSIEGAGSLESGRYTVVIKRKLSQEGQHSIHIKEGEVITAGVAVHDDNTMKRKHYVSFPLTIGLGAAADIKAQKISNQ